MPRRGFTLLEVLVALVVLAIGVLAFVRVTITDVEAVAMARDRTLAAGMAESKLAELSQDVESAEGRLSGRFEDPRFTWRSTMEDASQPKLRKLGVTVEWSRGRHRRRFMLETLVRTPEPEPAQVAKPKKRDKR